MGAAGIPLPALLQELRLKLKKKDHRIFSTRFLEWSPYYVRKYLNEIEENNVPDYAIIAHSGHGLNSWAVQYYLVWRTLRIFVHLPWRGAYMDGNATTAKIRNCFSMVDKIVQQAEGVPAGCRLAPVLLAKGGGTLIQSRSWIRRSSGSVIDEGSCWRYPVNRSGDLSQRDRPHSAHQNLPSHLGEAVLPMSPEHSVTYVSGRSF